MSAKQIHTTEIKGPSQKQTFTVVGKLPNLNDDRVQTQLREVKTEIKTVLEGANVDAKKLSLRFII